MRSDRVCVICGGTFRPYHGGHICCSPDCQRERKRRCSRRWYAAPANRRRHAEAALRSYHQRRTAHAE